MRPLLLDLFAGAGGAAVGYERAGFRVVGVDVKPQPRYPFELHVADALDVCESILNGGHWFYEIGEPDAIHASPPCLPYTALRHTTGRTYPELVEPTRAALEALAPVPYVIENVPGAPLINPVIVCGTSVGLPFVECDDKRRQVWRHRLFETNWPLLVPPCAHTVPALGTYGHGGSWLRTGSIRGGYTASAAEKRLGMGTEWMTRDEAADAVPPAYTELIGTALLAFLNRREAA